MVQSKAPEDETLPVITNFSAASGAEKDKMKKTAITDCTSNSLFINNPPTSKLMESVQVQTLNPRPLSVPESEQDKGKHTGSCYTSTTTSTSPQPPLCSSERSSASEFSSFNMNSERQSVTPLTDCNEESNSDPDGFITPSFPIASHSYPLLTVPHVPYTGYTEITIPTNLPQPPLPEKQRSSPLHNMSDCTPTSSIKSAGKPSVSSAQFHVSFSTTTNEVPPKSTCRIPPSSGVEEPESRLGSKFVQDSSKYWYKPGISRDQGENVCYLYLCIWYMLFSAI